jgi:ABC-type dipeptide/oligopeptide/nickel transport system permease component
VIPTLVGISLLAFALVKLAPGDAAEIYAARTLQQQPTREQVAAARVELGLDRPLVVQYTSFVANAVRGDLGNSYSTGRPVTTELFSHVPATLEIAVPAAIVAFVVGVAAGIICAVYRNRVVDQLVRVGSLVGASLPSFWLALMLIVVFAVTLSWFPVAGRDQPSSYVLPIATLAAAPTAVFARFARSAVLETLGEDYVRTARGKGVSEALVVLRHALRNALIPVVTQFGTQIGILAAGAVIVENIFAWPGVGQLGLTAIQERDYPVVEAFVLYAGFLFVIINLLVDLSYVVIDPRVRLGARS